MEECALQVHYSSGSSQLGRTSRTLQKSCTSASRVQSCAIWSPSTINRYNTGSFQQVGATTFIEWDPELEDPRLWPCRTTLEALAITTLPQQDTSAPNGQQADDRRFIEIQQRVFQRLGEFANPRIVKLGHTATHHANQYTQSRDRMHVCT